MAIAYGLVYGLPWMRFIDVQLVLRKAAVYGNRVRSVYGSVYGPCMVRVWLSKLFGRAPRKTLRRSGSIDHTQESSQPTIRKPPPRDHTRNTRA